MRFDTTIVAGAGVVLALFAPLAVSADTAVASDAGLESAVGAVRESQGITDADKIECDKVSDAQFEAIGEAYMDVVHPNQDEHEIMDAMMGGEGSAQLDAAHEWMGRQYVGCVTTGMYGGGFGMMGGGMTGSNVFYRNAATPTGSYGMMGGAYPAMYGFSTVGGGTFGWVTPVLMWLFFGLGAAWFAVMLFGKKK